MTVLRITQEASNSLLYVPKHEAFKGGDRTDLPAGTRQGGCGGHGGGGMNLSETWREWRRAVSH